MKQHYELVVVVPVGPNADINFVADTIESVYSYCRCSCKIILSDDSQGSLGNKLNSRFPEIDLIVNKKVGGTSGGLYINLSYAIIYALKNYRFKTLLKLDTDALVIGFDPQQEAEKLFASRPEIGIAGFHAHEKSNINFQVVRVDTVFPRRHLLRATGTWRFLRRPVGNFVLRKYYQKALKNGYETGEHIFGGSYFWNEAALIQLEKNKMLLNYYLQHTRLEEDHLFSLLAKAAGFELGDLGSAGKPFACAWKGLPASPEELVSTGKKIVHSTRSWGNMDEQQIRAFFKSIRDVQVITKLSVV